MSIPKTTDDWGSAKEVTSNWMKFEKVGDKIKGTLLSKRLQKANLPGYQDQWVYEIKKEDGSVYNVGISVGKDGTIQRLNNCKTGEIIGILFEKEGEAKKGFKPAKYLKVVTFGMDETYNEMDAGEEVEVPEM
jgi:predicted small secreted protein